MARRSYERCERASQPGRGFRRMMFIGMLAIVFAVIGTSADPKHRLNGLLFGGLGGMFLGIALLAWPTNSDYPSDYIDKTLD